jgi:hypothetical protein
MRASSPNSRAGTWRRAIWLRCLMVAMMVCAGLGSWVQAVAGEWANEYQLKAAFVYKLMSFVEWPANVVGGRMIVGFAGEGAMATSLMDSINGKRLGAVPIQVRNVRTPAEMRECNVLIVGYPDHSRTQETLSYVKNMNMLTIGDGEEFARMGGMVALVPYQNTFHITVNPRAVERAHLKLSAKLLSLAKLLPDDDGRAR